MEDMFKSQMNLAEAKESECRVEHRLFSNEKAKRRFSFSGYRKASLLENVPATPMQDLIVLEKEVEMRAEEHNRAVKHINQTRGNKA